MESVRTIVCHRDNITGAEFDEILLDFQENLSDDPEDDIAQCFGPGPDYLLDREILAAIEAGR